MKVASNIMLHVIVGLLENSAHRIGNMPYDTGCKYVPAASNKCRLHNIVWSHEMNK